MRLRAETGNANRTAIRLRGFGCWKRFPQGGAGRERAERVVVGDARIWAPVRNGFANEGALGYTGRVNSIATVARKPGTHAL